MMEVPLRSRMWCQASEDSFVIYPAGVSLDRDKKEIECANRGMVQRIDALRVDLMITAVEDEGKGFRAVACTSGGGDQLDIPGRTLAEAGMKNRMQKFVESRFV